MCVNQGDVTINSTWIVNCSDLNMTYMKEKVCKEKNWNGKLACTFPLMEWWIPGTLSVIVLILTYFAEVISVYCLPKFEHYLQLFTRVNVNKCGKFLQSCILALSQQIAILVYTLWVKGM